jgi:hypothetical protein
MECSETSAILRPRRYWWYNQDSDKRNEKDFIAWYPDKRGIFTVKSAYQLGLHSAEWFHDRGATSTRPDGIKPGWKLIWSYQVPPEVKLLAWKICRNAIATQVNLARRKISLSNLCPICGSESEDTFHVFIRCPHARCLWQATTQVWPLPPDVLLKNTGHEWLLNLLSSIPEVQHAPIVLTIWRIWHAHNELHMRNHVLQ